MKVRLPVSSAAAITLLLIAVSETGFMLATERLTGMPIFQPTTDDAIMVVKRQLLPRASGAIVFLGDSSCNNGLIPEVFQRRGLGLPVNLGIVVNFSMPGFAVVAKEALALEPPPRALILAVLPRSFEWTEEKTREWSMLGRYLVAYGGESPQYQPKAADYWSWFCRKHRYNVFPPEFGGSFRAFTSEMVQSNGFKTERAIYTGVPSGNYQSVFAPSAFARDGFLELATAARSRNVPLVLWWSPSPRDSVSDEYISGASGYALSLANELSGLRLGRVDAPTWEPRWFTSVTHVTKEGAVLNTEQLAQYIVDYKIVVP